MSTAPLKPPLFSNDVCYLRFFKTTLYNECSNTSACCLLKSLISPRPSLSVLPIAAAVLLYASVLLVQHQLQADFADGCTRPRYLQRPDGAHPAPDDQLVHSGVSYQSHGPTTPPNARPPARRATTKSHVQRRHPDAAADGHFRSPNGPDTHAGNAGDAGDAWSADAPQTVATRAQRKLPEQWWQQRDRQHAVQPAYGECRHPHRPQRGCRHRPQCPPLAPETGAARGGRGVAHVVVAG